MQILDELYNETKRLFIAGSKFAKGDPRISKYIPILEKMGEKAPVMKKLAEKYTALVKDGQPDALAEAGTFLYAVMATQGATEVNGEVAEEAPSIHELPKTGTPYSRLKPVLDALTFSKPGRYEIIRSAFEEGLLKDFRLYGPLVAALDDKYSLLAEYIYETVIPAIGAPLIPYVLEQYDPKGKQSDAMRISLLNKLGYENIERIAFDAVEDGDPLVAVEGIKILGANPENEEYLLTLAKDKKAAVREAALIGLVIMDSAQGKELMMKTLQSSKYKSAVQAAKVCHDTEYVQKMLDLVRPYYDKLFEKDLPNKDFIEVNKQFSELFGALENKDEAAVYKFFTEILKNRDYLKKLSENKIYTYPFHDVQSLTCQYLLKSPADKVIQVCEDAMSPNIAEKSPGITIYYFRTADQSYKPERIFDVFSKYYEAGTVSFMEMFFPNGFFPEEWNCAQEREAEIERIRSVIDPRWKKLVIKKNDVLAISALLCEGDEYEQEMKNAVLKQVKEAAAKKRADLLLGRAVGRLIETTQKKKAVLFKSELEKAAEICYEVFEKTDGYSLEYFYEGIGKENFLQLFYPAYSQKFKALAQQKTAPVFQRIAEALQ